MEKNDIADLLEIFREKLKDDRFSQRFLVSLSSDIFYHIDSDTYYTFPTKTLLELSTKLSDYRNKEFFKEDSKYDYIRYFSKITYDGGYGHQRKIDPEKSDDFTLRQSDTLGFIIMEYSRENIEYIKVLSRDNKINKIIK